MKVEAIQFLGHENVAECRKFCPVLYQIIKFGANSTDYFEVETPEGRVSLSIGSWIVRGTMGEFYPVQDSIFQATFEEIDDGHIVD